MNLGSGGGAKVKAWKDIWGVGQGTGAVKRVAPAVGLVKRLAEEFEVAHRRLGNIEALYIAVDSRATA